MRGQNVQFSAGSFGGEPSPDTQMFTASVSAEGRFSSPEQFEQILLRTDANGATVRLKDIARIELSGSAHGFDLNGTASPPPASRCCWDPARMRWQSPPRSSSG